MSTMLVRSRSRFNPKVRNLRVTISNNLSCINSLILSKNISFYSLNLSKSSQTNICIKPRSYHTTTHLNTANLERVAVNLEFKTITEMIESSVRVNAKYPAFGTYCPSTESSPARFDWITYAELGKQISDFRRVLHKYNVEKGSKVAIISNNRVEWAVAMFSTLSLGAQLVPMYEAQTEKDWKHIIEDSGAKIILVANGTIYNKVLGYIGTVGNVHAVLSFDTKEEFMHSYKKWMKQADSLPEPPPTTVSEHDHAFIIYTSGTTGKPKGVILSHCNQVSNLLGIHHIWKDELYRHTALSFLPWAHVFGQISDMQAMLSVGSAVAIVSQRELILECAQLIKPTFIAAVPMLFNKVYDGVHKKVLSSSPVRQSIFRWAMSVSRRYNHRLEFHQPVSMWLRIQFKLADKLVFEKIRLSVGGRIHYFASGGAAVAKNVLEFFEDVGMPVCEGYGLTETSPVISSGRNDWETRRLGCAGVPLHNLDVKLMDPETLTILTPSAAQPVPEGEIIVSGPSVMVGYHNNPMANEEVFLVIDGKRYFRSGDLGQLVENKFLKITGRIKEKYKLENGKYVVPTPLEDDMTRSQFISQAFLYGDNKQFNIALIVLDFVEVKNWLKNKGSNVSDSDISQLTKHDQVIQLIAREIRQVCGTMKSYERPHRFALLTEGFTVENQMLTPKMSMKRKKITTEYKDLIEGIYNNTHGHTVPMKQSIDMEIS